MEVVLKKILIVHSGTHLMPLSIGFPKIIYGHAHLTTYITLLLIMKPISIKKIDIVAFLMMIDSILQLLHVLPLSYWFVTSSYFIWFAKV